jgi:hypothetical protein
MGARTSSDFCRQRSTGERCVDVQSGGGVGMAEAAADGEDGNARDERWVAWR